MIEDGSRWFARVKTSRLSQSQSKTNGVCDKIVRVEELLDVKGGPDSALAIPKNAWGITMVLISVRVKLYKRKTGFGTILRPSLSTVAVSGWEKGGIPLPMFSRWRYLIHWLGGFLVHVVKL